jgi:hypothetical protein
MRSRTASPTAVLALLVIWLAPGPVNAASKASVYLGQAKVSFQGLDYEKCVQRLNRASRNRLSRHEQAEIELYNGLCKFHLGARDAAESHFRAALALEPALDLPAGSSPRVLSIFESSKPRPKTATLEGDGRPPPAPDPLPAATRDAPLKATLEPRPPPEQPSIVQAAPTPSRFPVVAGSLGAAAVLAAGAATWFGLSAQANAARFNDPNTFQADADLLGPQAEGQARTANLLFGVAGAAAVAATIALLTGN